jgi:monovalent cation:H+ antiporter-2, CPA2 family
MGTAMHVDSLVVAISLGIVLAFSLGFIAHKLRLPPLLGYLCAGMIVGPFTPGFVADQDLHDVAEVGIALLMFGVGIHFSFKDLMNVRKIAIPGALAQIAFATLLGLHLGMLWGLPMVESLLLGVSLSVASTIVLLKALEDRNEISTKKGHIAVGWLIVEDIFVITVLVLLPSFSLKSGPVSALDFIQIILISLLKIGLFITVMLLAGKKVMPFLLSAVEKSRSSLGVLACALGVAYAAYAFFDTSLALGAFFAGLVLNNTSLTHKVVEHLLPLRHTFAALFFVSVGMLFDPSILLEAPLAVFLLLGIIIIGKSIAALCITYFYRCTLETGLTIAASLAQIGEFSFILSNSGVKLGLISVFTYKIILASAIISITLNPLLFKWAERTYQKRA